MSRLSAAVLRVSASLDPDTVAREAAECIRALTGAPRAVVVTGAGAGVAAGFEGSGFTADERRRLAAWPGGPRLFDQLLNLPGVTRLPDLQARLRSLGIPLDAPLPTSGLAAPLLHRGAPVGAVLVGVAEGGNGSSSEDREVLEAFAAHAATAIANARIHRDERRVRADLLSVASHELRAPLASIKGSCAAVLDVSPDPEPAEMRQFFRIVDAQADHMRRLVGDLLAAARLDAGAPVVVPEPVAVAALVEPARQTFLSGGGRHAVRVDLPPDLPRVSADPQRIAQVLNNLLSNAAQNSPASSPVRVAAARDGDRVAISVSDEGPGVPPERLPHLFRTRASAAADRAHGGGNGRGLPICKGLVEAHGGRIWAESGGDGPGTRVVFTIPVAGEAGGSSAVDDGTSRDRRPGERRGEKRILVVDDDPLALRSAREALTAAGYATG